VTSVLYIKDVCRKCIFISEVRNNNCYDVKTGHRCNVVILTNTCNVAVFDINKRGLVRLKLEEAHVTRDSDTTFKVSSRFKVNLQGRGMLWRPPAQLVYLGRTAAARS